VDTSTCPFGLVSARESQGSHVTATGMRPATNAAPASPEVMSVFCTSSRDMPCLSRTYASSHSLVEPSLTATFWPFSWETESIPFLATIPSPPTEASRPSTTFEGTPFAAVRAYVSTVEAMPSSRPALKAAKRCTGSSISVYETFTPSF
jgi:hypothetical protein